jgi:hippurate hydrolase
MAMIGDGVLDNPKPSAAFGLHLWSRLPLNQVVVQPGPLWAATDRFRLVVRGRGGHGAIPHETVDPIVAASAIVTAWQSIVARNVDPLETAVVTVGVFQSGVANNVIPASARLELSVRALNREVRALLKERIHALVAAQAQSFGVTAEVDWRDGYPVLVNTPDETAFAAKVGLELLGADKVVLEPPPVTGSEDFAFMLEHRPGCYLLLGNGDGAGSCMVHNPGYDFNDAAMETGAAYWSLLAERFLV